MAAFCFTEIPTSAALYGRSGYNKDDNEDDKNRGRSGYNKTGNDEDDDRKNFGRSGYNKDDNEDDK